MTVPRDRKSPSGGPWRSLPLITDGKIEVIGPDFSEVEEQGAMDMGIVIDVAGRQMEPDFEPVLERQIHYFINGASGVQHIGQRDITFRTSFLHPQPLKYSAIMRST